MDKTLFRSIAQYAKVLKHDERARVYAPLCESYRKVGLLDDAIKTGLRGLEIFPSYLACREALGKAYFKKGLHAEAAEHLEPVAKVVKDNLVVKKMLAKICLAQGKLDEARALFEFVNKRDPLDFEASSLLISTERRLSGEEPVEAEFEAAVSDRAGTIEEEIESVEIDFDKIEVYRPEEYVEATDKALGDLDGLEVDLDQVAERLVSDEKVDPRLRLKKIASKIETAEEARVKQVEIKAAAHLAQVHMELSLLDEAINTSQKLLKEDPDNPEVIEMMQRFQALLAAKEEECDRLETMEDLTEAVTG